MKKRLSNTTIKRKLTAYLLRNPAASDRDVAKDVGCAAATVRRYRSNIGTPLNVLVDAAEKRSAALDVGAKHDTGKLPWHLLPSDAIESILRVMDYGQHKYAPRNWEKGMAWSRAFSALMRHMWAWWMGEDKDRETGESHLAHAGCCLLFLLAYETRNIGTDDRSKQ